MSIFSKPLLWVTIIFICAATFRLTALDLIEFKLDEARDVYEMERFWQNPHILERGTIQSTGVYNPPLWYLLLAVISAPSRDPQYLSFMIALINCLAVAGFYLVIKKFYGSRIKSGMTKGEWFGVAEAAGLLLAFSPWSILMSRKIWAPDMVLPLLVPFLYCLFKIVIPRSEATSESLLKESRLPHPAKGGVRNDTWGWAWFGLILSLSLLAQLHASGVFLIIATVIVLFFSYVIPAKAGIQSMESRSKVDPVLRRDDKLKLNFKFALFGLFLGLIPLLPYINYQIRTGCEDCRNYSAYQEGEAAAMPIFDENAFLRPFQFINGSGWDNTLGDEGFRDFKESYPIAGLFNFIFLLEFLLLPVGLFYIFKHKKEHRFLIAFLLLIPVLYFITKTPSHLYYFLIISPITILIYTFGIFHLRGEKMRLHLGGVILGIIITINIIFELMFYSYLSETKVISGDYQQAVSSFGGYGATYGVVKEMVGEKQGLERAEFFVNLFNSRKL